MLFRSLNGRNFEYMGEDPFLASIMVVPYIQGLQSKGVSACVKHYCLNNDEEYRHQVNVIVSDRALHEIYLPAFKAAVEKGKTWGIMGAYNLYKNEHNCHNQWTLNKILKGDWKYDGVVVSSIQPYEDCCTIFVAKHPVTKPRVDLIRKSEILLQEEIDQMMERAFATEEIIEIK